MKDRDMIKKREYIGVSGVVNTDQQEELETIFRECELDRLRTLQLGVKATHKPQYLGIENRYGREWYPVGREIENAVSGSGRSTRVAQVCFDTDLVRDDNYRGEFFSRALGVSARTWLTGVQFDMIPWYDDLSMLEQTFRAAHRLTPSSEKLTMTLQCQGEIMHLYTPKQIAARLGQVAAVLDHVLFDSSCGRGVRLDTKAILPYLEAFRENNVCDHVGIAVGGGLNAEVVREELPKIIKHFPDVSWDAEGQLHPVDAKTGRRPLDMRVCREYFEASAEVLG